MWWHLKQNLSKKGIYSFKKERKLVKIQAGITKNSEWSQKLMSNKCIKFLYC